MKKKILENLIKFSPILLVGQTFSSDGSFSLSGVFAPIATKVQNFAISAFGATFVDFLPYFIVPIMILALIAFIRKKFSHK